MNTYIDQLKKATVPYTQQIVNHPAYAAIHNISDVKHFMEHHIFAVWDFMSLLKSLQVQLTCVSIPWIPLGSPQVRFLINEIVCGEESDIAYGREGHISHFELYLEAMDQVGASRKQIDELIDCMKSGVYPLQAIEQCTIPQAAKQFLHFTFEVIATQKPHIIAAVFTFGREDLIPQMFLSIVKDLQERFPNQLDIFNYYLERHIEVDGDHHSHLALEMVNELCGQDAQKWEEAQHFVIRSLESRIALWDGVQKAISENN
jgi:hypothetical protein